MCKVTAPRIYNLHPNQDHQKNNKEMLNKRSDGETFEKISEFLCIGSLVSINYA